MKRNSIDTRLEGMDWDALERLTQTDNLYGYREFCRLVGLKIQSSGSNMQIRQLNELSMVCEYEKVNSKYRFVRMRTADEIMLYKERSIFTPLIEYCLSEKFLQLRQQDDPNFQDGVLFFSIGSLMSWCGIVHENYQFMRQGHDRFERKIAICLKHGFDLGELSRFLSVSYEHILKPMIRSALKSMDNKKSIVIHKGFKVFDECDSGRRIYKNLLATSPDGQRLERIVAQAYTEFGIKKVQELFFASQELRQEIYHRCNSLCKQELGHDGFYDCYAIVVNDYRTRFNMGALRHELNERVQRRMLESHHLRDIRPSSKEKFVTTMVSLTTHADFESDLEEYHRYKMTGGN